MFNKKESEPLKSFSSLFFILVLSLLVINGNKIYAQDYIWAGFDDRVKASLAHESLDFSSFASKSAGKVEPNAFGDFSYTIPIFNVPGRKIGYPLSLAYTPGITVTQEAGWVGLGWSLNEAYVKRIQFGGLADDKIPFDTNLNSQEGADRFQIVLPDGRSATVFQSDETTTGRGKFVIEEWKKWSIEYDETNHRFIVKDETGTIYVFGLALFGAFSKNGFERQGWNTCNPHANKLYAPKDEPFHQWMLTAILTSGYHKTSGDFYNPMESGNGQINNGSWIQIFYEFAPSVPTKKFEYTTEALHKLESYDGCVPRSFSDGMRAFEKTYMKHIVTPTHIAEFVTEAEPYNPISELLEREWSDAIDEYTHGLSWEFRSDFTAVSGDVAGEKMRRLINIKLYRNELVSNNITGLTNPLKNFELEYFGVGGASPGYDEERSMLKEVELVRETDFEPIKYSFTYYDIIQASHLETGTNTLKRNNTYDQAGDRNMIQYYRSANNNPDESMIGPDGFFNSNSLLDLEGSLHYVPNPDDIKMWNLKRVTYPNASYIEFDYESDEYVLDWFHEGDTRPSGKGINANPVQSNIGFGYRLKSQKIFTDVLKTYTYDYASYNSNTSSWVSDIGRIYADPIEYHSLGLGSGGSSPEYTRQSELPPTNWFSKLTSQRPVYGKVVENRPDGTKIERFYDVADLDFDYEFNGSKTVQQIFDITIKKRGDLVQEDWFDNLGTMVKRYTKDDTRLVQADINNYAKYSISHWLSVSESKNVVYYSGTPVTSDWIEETYYTGNGLISKQTNKNTGVSTEYTYAFDLAIPYSNYLRSNNQVSEVREVLTKGGFGDILSRVYMEYYPSEYNHVGLRFIDVREIGSNPSTEFRLFEFINKYDKHNNLFEFLDANQVSYAIHSTSKDGVPKAIFSNANYRNTFFDGFDDGNYDNNYRPILSSSSLSGWYVSSGTWEIQDGKLKKLSGTGTIYHDLNTDLNSGNQSFELDIYPGNIGTDAELRIRSHSVNTNHYKIRIRNTLSGTKDIRLYKNSNLLVSGSISSLETNYTEQHHLKVIMNSNNLTIYLNGKKFINYVDGSHYASGGIGIWTNSLYSGQSFDNIRIYPSDATVASQSIDADFLKISSITDANGISSYFEYDDLGRLDRSRDELGKVISSNSYSTQFNQVSTLSNRWPYNSDNLVGGWSFENNLAGKTENKARIHGTMYNASGQVSLQSTSFYGEGVVGNGLFIDSDPFDVTEIVSVGDIDELDHPANLSVSLWFKRLSNNTEATANGVRNVLIANSSVSSNDNFEIGTSGTSIQIYMDSGTGLDGVRSYNAGIQNGKWYHIAFTYDGMDAKLYLNGTLVQTWTAEWFDPLDDSEFSKLSIGAARPSSPVGTFDGYIDEVYVFTRELEDSEISALANVFGSVQLMDDNGNVINESSYGAKESSDITISVGHTYDNMNRKLSTTRPNSTDKVETAYWVDPLNRPKEIKLPGTGTEIPGTNITTYSYAANTTAEVFNAFETFNANTLHKTIINDPNGKKTIEYTDGSGRKIASVVDMDGNGAKSPGDLVTEFGYDDLGNLTKIKDPRGLTTQYEYDALSRMTRKKLPDQDNWVNYKYDNSGNVRFVETAEHKKAGSATSTVFSELGSVDKTIVAAKTGVLKFDVSISDMEFGNFTTQIKDASQANVTIFEGEIQHDDGWEVSDWQELSVSAGTYRFYGTVQNQNDGWSDVSGTFSFKPYTFSYTKYDNLNRITEVGEYYGSTSFASADATNASFPGTDTRILIAYKYDEENGYSGARNLAGNLAQVWYYNPNAFKYGPSKTYYSYNEQGLVEWIVQELRRDNGLSITKTIEYEYDKAGNLLELRYNPGGSDSFYQRYTYDGLNRVTKAETSLSGSVDEWLTSAAYTYKSDGQVEQLILGENAQMVDYTYDTRGWLTGINNSGSVGSGPQQDRFFQALDYFSTSVASSKRQYNGNIAQQSWGFDTRLINKPDQTYTYTYDNANRLTNADRSGSGYTSTAFDVGPLSYDANGNITLIYRRNESGSLYSAGHLGHLQLNREAGSNRLMNVTEMVVPELYDVDYDANGNLIKNDLHNLKKTTFDLANMPVRSISGSGVVQYRYGPDGQRVAKSVFGGTGTLYVRGAGGETLAVYDHNGNLLFHNVLVGSEIIGKTN